MRAIRAYLIVLCVLVGATGSAQAWVSINIDLFPELVPVPGYPVYYAPRMSSNYFFYDGMYWVYEDDEWYVSDWYNGPWEYVDPMFVPVYVLRIPVRYYRRPPVYFREWRPDAPPRWGYHWGRDWERRRGGWDHWDRAHVPALAPLPVYQRQYAGDRYPREEKQREIRANNYRYEPRDSMVREHYQAPVKRVSEPARDNRSEREPGAQRGNDDRQRPIERESSERYGPQPGPNRPESIRPEPTRRESRPESIRQEPMRQEQIQRDQMQREQMQREQMQREQMQRESARPPREFNSRGNEPGPSPDRGRGRDKDRDDDRR